MKAFLALMNDGWNIFTPRVQGVIFGLRGPFGTDFWLYRN
jgi:hypothetical protein